MDFDKALKSFLKEKEMDLDFFNEYLKDRVYNDKNSGVTRSYRVIGVDFESSMIHLIPYEREIDATYDYQWCPHSHCGIKKPFDLLLENEATIDPSQVWVETSSDRAITLPKGLSTNSDALLKVLYLYSLVSDTPISTNSKLEATLILDYSDSTSYRKDEKIPILYEITQEIADNKLTLRSISPTGESVGEIKNVEVSYLFKRRCGIVLSHSARDLPLVEGQFDCHHFGK